MAPDWAGPADAVPRDLYESDGFELAIAKVIARLIGLGVWDIYQRTETARHRGSRICTTVAAAVAVLATASGVLTWQSHRNRLAVAEFAALAERYKLASPTQAAAPGAKESIAEAITIIAEGAATDPRYAEALEFLKAGKVAEAEPPLQAAAEDKAMRVAQAGMPAGAGWKIGQGRGGRLSGAGIGRRHFGSAAGTGILCEGNPVRPFGRRGLCFGMAGSNRRPANSTWRRRPIAG